MRYGKAGIKIGITIGLFVLLFRSFDIQALSLLTKVKDWRYIAGAVGVSLTVVPFISIKRWQLFLRVSGIVENSWTLWRINLTSLFQGLAIPSTQGFDILRIYQIDKRHPDRRGYAGSTVLIERMMGMALLCVMSLAAAFALFGAQNHRPIILTTVIVNLVVFLALCLILSKKLHGHYTGHKFGNHTVAKVFEYIDTIHGAVVHFPYRKVLPSSLIWISSYQLATVFVVYLVFCAYGHQIPFVKHLAIYPMIAILALAPVSIGGFGVREGLFVFFYSSVGVPPPVAVGASILQYVILILVPAFLGGVLVLWQFLFGEKAGNRT